MTNNDDCHRHEHAAEQQQPFEFVRRMSGHELLKEREEENGQLRVEQEMPLAPRRQEPCIARNPRSWHDYRFRVASPLTDAMPLHLDHDGARGLAVLATPFQVLSQGDEAVDAPSCGLLVILSCRFVAVLATGQVGWIRGLSKPKSRW